MPPITDAPGIYGDSTAAAVLIYKQKNSIVRPGQPLDNIVGRMTITQIDDDLVRGVKPIPPPPPPPIVGDAGIQIGPLGDRGRFVTEYYNKCGLETIGPGQIRTGGLRHYSTLEELIDVLLARSEFHQVIVNHGDQIRGLILPFVRGSPFNGTGNVVGVLSILADRDNSPLFCILWAPNLVANKNEKTSQLIRRSKPFSPNSLFPKDSEVLPSRRN